MNQKSENSQPCVAVFGAGAVGCYFGGLLARAGIPVTLIGRARHVEAMMQNGLFLDSVNFQYRVRVKASTDAAAVQEADIVLLCVKTLDTEIAARTLAPLIKSHTLVMSLQNGVDNVARIHAAAGIEAIPAVVYVAAAMAAPGHVKHTGRGDLIIGESITRGHNLEKLAALFMNAEVPCVVSKNIAADLWTKLVMNCAYNAISALCHAKYARLARPQPVREVMMQAMQEAIAVARAEGVAFPNVDLITAGLQLAETMKDATSSTAQDLARGKRTEIEALNGYVARRGKELGVAAPVNQTLYALVKLLEEEMDLNNSSNPY